MSNGLNNQAKTVRGQARAISSEVKELQQLLSRALVGIESRLSQQAGVLNNVTRVLNALVQLVGAEDVQAVIEGQAREEAERREQAERAALQEAIDDGYATLTDRVETDSLLVGEETDADGKPVGTGRQQIGFRSIEASLQASVLGKEAGDVITTPVGGQFKITEIYKIDEVKGRAIHEAKAAAASAQLQGAAEVAKEDEKEDTKPAHKPVKRSPKAKA